MQGETIEAIADQAVSRAIVAMIEKGSALGPYAARLGNDPRSISRAMELHGIITRKIQSGILFHLSAQHGVVVEEYLCPSIKRYKRGLRTARGPVGFKWRKPASG